MKEEYNVNASWRDMLERIKCKDCGFDGDEMPEDDGGFVCPECGSFGPERTKEC